MATRLRISDIEIDVVRKDIKNVHLSVYPPEGRVRISAPSHMSAETIRLFAIAKLDWIRREQSKLRIQPRETARTYENRESHYLWGERLLLTVSERDAAPRVEIKPGHMRLSVRPGSDLDRRAAVVDAFYRAAVKAAVPPLLARWEPRLDVSCAGFYVQRMKTKWGSCNPKARTIRLNTELAKKPPVCLEYIVVHELMHLLEPTHNPRFRVLMDHHFPQWRQHRDTLNALPVRQEDWEY